MAYISTGYGYTVSDTVTIKHTGSSDATAYDLVITTTLESAGKGVVSRASIGAVLKDDTSNPATTSSTGSAVSTVNDAKLIQFDSFAHQGANAGSFSLVLSYDYALAAPATRGDILEAAVKVQWANSDGGALNAGVTANIRLKLNYTSNQAPSFAKTHTTYNCIEDKPLDLALILTDPDFEEVNNNGWMTVTILSTGGTVHLNTTEGLYMQSGHTRDPLLDFGYKSSAGTNMVFRSWLAPVQDALRNAVFLGTADYTGSASVSVAVDDEGNGGVGGAKSVTKTLAISISAVNDPPRITSPDIISATEDTSFYLSSISITDIDSGSNTVTLVVSASWSGSSVTLDAARLTSVGISSTQTATNILTVSPLNSQFSDVLQAIKYTPPSHWNIKKNGYDTLTISVDDSGNTGSGSDNTASATVLVDVAAVDETFVITLAAASVNTNEDTVFLFGSQVTLSDVDGYEEFDALYEITLTATTTGALLTLNVTKGVHQTNTGISANSIRFFIAPERVNSILSNVYYTPKVQWSGTDTITVNAKQRTAAGASDSSWDVTSTFNVVVAAVNDGVVLVVPASVDAVEDTVVSVTGISFSDIDETAVGPVYKVTIAAVSGKVSMTTTTGLTFTTGSATGYHSTLVFTGQSDVLNTALGTLQFEPNQDYNGITATITVTVDDQGNTGSGSATTDTGVIKVYVSAVNDGPYFTVPSGTITLEENAQKVFSSGQITLTDVDVNEEPASLMKIELTCNYGTISLGTNQGFHYITGTGVNDTKTELEGGYSRIQKALVNLIYRPTAYWSGSDTVTLKVWDQANSGSGGEKTSTSTIALTVTAKDTPIVAAAPSTLAAVEDVGVVIPDITLVDQDSLTGSITATLTVEQGSLTVATVTGVTTASPTPQVLQLSGVLSAVSTSLTQVTYLSATHKNVLCCGPDKLTLGVKFTSPIDSTTIVNSIPVTTQILVAGVNDAPVITVSGVVTTTEDKKVGLTTVSVSDVDINEVFGAQFKVQILSGTEGKLTPPTVAGADIIAGETDDYRVTFRASSSVVASAIANTFYTPYKDFVGSDTLKVIVSDLGQTGSGGVNEVTASVTVTVSAANDPPIIKVSPSDDTITIPEDTALNLYVTITDVDSTNANQVAVVSCTYGSLTVSNLITGITATNAGTDTLTLTWGASGATADHELHIVYQPNSNFFSTHSVHDGISIEVTDATSTKGTYSLTVRVTPVNDGPTLSMPASVSTLEDEEVVISGITVVDTDVDQTFGGFIDVAVSAANGVVTLASDEVLEFIKGDGFRDYTIRFHASVDQANAALTGLRYLPNANWFGTDVVTIRIADRGQTGVSNAIYLVAEATTKVVVTAVNDPPRLTYAEQWTLNEDAVGTVPNVALSHDVGGDFTVVIGARHGLVRLGTVTGLTAITPGTNLQTFASRLEFSGDKAYINTAVAALEFQGFSNYNGPTARIEYSVCLHVHGVANTNFCTSAKTPVYVTAVNDAPVWTLPSSIVYTNEDTPLTFPLGDIVLTDVDVRETYGGTLKAKVTASNGVITLPSVVGMYLIQGDGDSDTVVEIQGAYSLVRKALDGLTYTPPDNWHGDATLTFWASDSGNTGSGGTLTATSTVTVRVRSVADPVTVAFASMSGAEDTAFALGTITLTQVEGLTTDVVTVTMTVPWDMGTLTMATGTTGISMANWAANYKIVFTGTFSDVAAALVDKITFTPIVAHHNSVKDFSVELDIAVSYDWADGYGQTDTIVTTGKTMITLTEVNDAPVLWIHPTLASHTINEDQNLLVTGISVTDVDLYDDPFDIFTLTLACNQGTLKILSTGGLQLTTGASAVSTLTFQGTLDFINRVLVDKIVYTPNNNYHGSDTITVTVNDNGLHGTGGSLTDSLTVAVTITAVNDRAILTGPATATVDEDASVNLCASTAFRIADDNNNDFRVTLSALHGTLSLPAAVSSGITIITGDGTDDRVVEFTGKAFDTTNPAQDGPLNLALAQVTYQGPLNWCIFTHHTHCSLIRTIPAYVHAIFCLWWILVV